MYVLNGIQKYAEVWKQNGWIGLSGEQIKYRSEWEGILIMLGSLKENNFTVKFSKVKSHNGNSLNELADVKAREAIKAYKEK
jgi:ribonuclease HI